MTSLYSCPSSRVGSVIAVIVQEVNKKQICGHEGMGGCVCGARFCFVLFCLLFSKADLQKCGVACFVLQAIIA